MKCVRCNNTIIRKWIISDGDIAKYVGYCAEHSVEILNDWRSGVDPVDDEGIPVENPHPDPGPPRSGRQIRLEHPLEDP